MPPCGTQDDENMMVLWRRSLYWSSSSVAVMAALVVLVIFERRASPYPLHLGRGSLFVPGARFSEQWTANLASVPNHSRITICSSMLACSGPLGPLSHTHTGEENCGKMGEALSPERYAVCQNGDGRTRRICLRYASLAGLSGVREVVVPACD